MNKRPQCRKFLSVFAAVLALLLTGGCSGPEERHHPLFLAGQRARASGKGEEAAQYFEKLLQRRPDVKYTHLELAGVYDELLDDPLRAVLHYQIYLSLVPDDPDAELIQSWQKQAEKRLRNRLQNVSVDNQPQSQAIAASSPATSSGELQELQTQLQQAKARMTMMREELNRLRAEKVAASQIPAEPLNSASKQPTETKGTFPMSYTVQPGDTPSKLALRFYGSSQKYPLILKANPQITARNMRPGIELVIPAPEP